MKLIVGLGNPGTEYTRTRHNAGFMALDLLHRNLGATAWRTKFEAEFAECTVGGSRTVLLKPGTYMNRSGVPTRSFVEFFKFEIKDVAVIHDDIDLALGTIRVRENGGDGGHNGIRSLVHELGTAQFIRIRIGVGRPIGLVTADGTAVPGIDVASWVLQKFASDEQAQIDEALARTEAIVEALFRSGLQSAQQASSGLARGKKSNV